MVGNVLDALAVGGGQAGLGMGRLLQEAGRTFIVLERGRIGETWRSQRWDSFAANTPNWSNGLPGYPYDGDQPDGFYLRDELVEFFERYAAHFELPIRLGVTVTGADPVGETGTFTVDAVRGDGSRESYETRNLVVASGLMQTPKIPGIGSLFPPALLQIHAAEYRSASAVPDGAVVVVGGGESGCQIAEDLIRADREVYLCTSRVARLPRRHRGRDILEWWDDMGLWDLEVGDLPDPAMQFAAQPQVSGVGRYGSTLSLQYMAGQGVMLMSRLSGVVDGVMTTDDSLAGHIAFADERSARFKADIDAFIARERIEAAEPEEDPIDSPAGLEVAAAGLTELDLAAAEVGAVIWCTGFTAQFEWLHVPVIGDTGHPVHERGVAAVPGVYFLGFPWLHSRKSGVIYGIEEDGRHLLDVMSARM